MRSAMRLSANQFSERTALATYLILSWLAVWLLAGCAEQEILAVQRVVPQLQENKVPGITIVGADANMPPSWMGKVHLETQSNAVFATFQATHATLQSHPRWQSEVLFVVPEGFRPPTTITWEIIGRPLPHSRGISAPQGEFALLKMSVDPEGQVRFVDSPKSDNWASLQYQSTVAWPLAGTSPQVCERNLAILEAIMDSLREQVPEPKPCAEVTWLDLSQIKSLKIDAYLTGQRSGPNFFPGTLRNQELVGLSNLSKLRWHGDTYAYDAVIPIELPTRFLSHTPLLRDLQFDWDVYLAKIPPDFLTHNPGLRSLYIESIQNRHLLPFGFLSVVPQLQYLDLNLTNTRSHVPANLLIFAPKLRVLRITLDVTASPYLRRDFLANQPELEVLNIGVYGEGLFELPVEFLFDTPNLEQVRMWTASVYSNTTTIVLQDIKSSFLANAPSLRQLWLLGVDTNGDFVSRLPRSAQVHWAAGVAGAYPSAENLNIVPSRHWIHLDAQETVFPAADAYLNVPINIEIGYVDGNMDVLEDWLASHVVRSLNVVRESDSSGFPVQPILIPNQPMLNWETLEPLSRLSVISPAGFTLHPLEWTEKSFEWVYLSNFAVMPDFEEFFTSFNANMLLIHPIPFGEPGSRPEADRITLTELMRAPRARHVGMILERDYFGSVGQGRRWILPADLLHNSEFECVEFDIGSWSTSPDLEYSILAPDDIDVEWVPTVYEHIWNSPRRKYIYGTHFAQFWGRAFMFSSDRYHDPSWFEHEHMVWVRERECERSLYLRFESPNISLEGVSLSPLGSLKHIRVVYPNRQCRDCPVRSIHKCKYVPMPYRSGRPEIFHCGLFIPGTDSTN